MTESIWKLGRVDLGYEPSGVLTLLLQPSSGQLQSPDQNRAYFDEMTRRIAAVPGVKSVGAVQHLPLSGFNWNADLEIESVPIAASSAHPRVVWRSVIGDYFGAMRIRLVRGRAFDATDGRDAPPVTIINEAMANRFWPNTDPIGQRVRFGKPSKNDWATVVGVVNDVRFVSPDAPAKLEAYRPNAQQNLVFMHYVIRVNGKPLARVADVRRAIRSLDATVPIAEVRALDDLSSAATATRRTIAQLLLAFAALGLTLAAVGIYGVISYGVAQRTQELGVRTALGAQQHRIIAMVVRGGVRMAFVGIAIGAVGAAAAAQSIQAFVFGVTTRDPGVYLGFAGVLVLVALIASAIPARRAARVDPLIALRGE
jgi:predicted permease